MTRIVELTARVATLCETYTTSEWRAAGEPLVATVRPRPDEPDTHHLHIAGGRHRDYPMFEAAEDAEHGPDVNVWHMVDVPEDLEAALVRALEIMEAVAAATASA